MQKGSFCVKSQGIMLGHNESCSTQKPSLQDPSLSPQGRVSRVGQVWKRKTDDWPEGRPRPGRTALYKWLNSLLRGNAHTLSLQLCISAFLLSQLNFLYVLSRLLFDAISLIINFVHAFTVSASVINAFFTGCKDPGENYLLASSPCWFCG